LFLTNFALSLQSNIGNIFATLVVTKFGKTYAEMFDYLDVAICEVNIGL